MHDQIDHARAVIDVERLLPCLAAIGRFENTPLFARPIQPAEDADIDGVRVLRMNDESADLI